MKPEYSETAMMKKTHIPFATVLSILACLPLFLFTILPTHAVEDRTSTHIRQLSREWFSTQPIESRELLSPTHVMVPMRDGIKLSTHIYKSPLSSQPQPAIVVRTPYDKDKLDIASFLLALQDFVIVTQDMRGRFASEGEDRVFQDDGWGERQDGYDTIEWVASQSWCDGKVGTYGPSALGIAQGLTAGANPPHLTCQLITFAASKGWGQTAYQGGAFRRSLVEGWLSGNNSAHMLPIFKAHPTADAFWDAYDIESHYPVMDVPVLHIGGWYDCFQQGTIHNFIGLQNNGAEGARGNQRLIMGPWTHVNQLNQTQGQLKYPFNSVHLNELALTLDWFKYWLLGEDNGAMDEPPIQYYVMGDVTNIDSAGNHWKTSATWPPITHTASLYLQPGNLLSSRPATSESNFEFQADPSDPVPTIGGLNLEIPAGPHDQTSLESRADTLVFSTPILEEPVEVVGPVKAILYASTNLTDTDLTVRLTDVYPDGRSMLVLDGIQRASFRHSGTSPNPIEPGQIHEYTIDLWSTGIVFDKGHQIRIIIANSNYPRFDLNPAYADLASGESIVTTIHSGPDSPSRLVLPTNAFQQTGIHAWDRY
ncbi:CocE/NonD family hydrolase [bacterium]|nr:CocE/NonD family hydrolase [bacterium]